MSARQYAFKLATEIGVELVGLAGIDMSYIEAPMPGRAGAAAWKARLESQLTAQAEESRRRLHETYEQECRARGVRFEWMSFEGDPISTLYLAAESCDLVVTGHDTGFRGQLREELADALQKLLLMTPRPVVVCADEPSVAGDVLIAYDGSVPSMRVLQMFALLGLVESQRVHVTSVDQNPEMAARRTVGASSYLRVHGYDVEGVPTASGIDPADALRIEVAARKIGTLVMGAYGHRGFREFLFGSTTRRLVQDPPCAIFIYH